MISLHFSGKFCTKNFHHRDCAFFVKIMILKRDEIFFYFAFWVRFMSSGFCVSLIIYLVKGKGKRVNISLMLTVKSWTNVHETNKNSWVTSIQVSSSSPVSHQHSFELVRIRFKLTDSSARSTVRSLQKTLYLFFLFSRYKLSTFTWNFWTNRS